MVFTALLPALDPECGRLLPRGVGVRRCGGGAGPGRGSTTADPIRYHPDDRFWEFQLIETAILLGITIVLLAIAWRLVLGRKAPAASDLRLQHHVVGDVEAQL